MVLTLMEQKMNYKVLVIGDSRKMKGGVSSVIKTLEHTPIWNDYNCKWVECQINSSILMKLAYLILGTIKGLFLLPSYHIVHFHTGLGNSMWVQMPLYLWAIVWRKKRIVHIHVGNQIIELGINRPLQFACLHAHVVLTLGKTWIPYIPHGTNTKVLHLYNPAPNVERSTSSDKYFLFAAYMTANKGYHHLLEAFARVIKRYPEWKLVMCGTGDIKDVQSCIIRLGLEDHVILPGWVEGEEKAEFFRHAYAYCMTSEMEGLPISVLEAVAYGIPVISTKVGCLPEILKADESVLFYDFDNCSQLEKQMISLIEEPAKREHVINHAYAEYEKNLSIRSFCKRLDAIYKDLIVC